METDKYTLRGLNIQKEEAIDTAREGGLRTTAVAKYNKEFTAQATSSMQDVPDDQAAMDFSYTQQEKGLEDKAVKMALAE